MRVSAVSVVVAILLRRNVFVLRSVEKLSASQLPTGKAQAMQRRQNTLGKSSFLTTRNVSVNHQGCHFQHLVASSKMISTLTAHFQAELNMLSDIPMLALGDTIILD